MAERAANVGVNWYFCWKYAVLQQINGNEGGWSNWLQMKSSVTHYLMTYSVYFTTVSVYATEPLLLVLIQLSSNAGCFTYNNSRTVWNHSMTTIEPRGDMKLEKKKRAFPGQVWKYRSCLVGSFRHSSEASSGLKAIVCEEESYQWICARLGWPTVPSIRLPVLPQEFFRGGVKKAQRCTRQTRSSQPWLLFITESGIFKWTFY